MSEKQMELKVVASMPIEANSFVAAGKAATKQFKAFFESIEATVLKCEFEKEKVFDDRLIRMKLLVVIVIRFSRLPPAVAYAKEKAIGAYFALLLAEGWEIEDL